MNATLSSFDINWGIGWSKRISKTFEPFFSYAMFHSHFPKETFFEEGDNHLKPRSIINAGATIKLSAKVSAIPNMLMQYNVKASEFLMGSNVEYTLSEGENVFKRKAIYAGLFERSSLKFKTDAAFVVVGLKYNNWNTAVSYDVNISQLHPSTNYKGAFEFSFIYTGISTRLPKTEIPCDRY